MAGHITAQTLSELMFEAALAVGDAYHGGNANRNELETVTQAYAATAAALQDRADAILMEIYDDQT